MSHDAQFPDLVIAERDHLRYRLGTPLTVISARAQLLERHLERAAGLTDPERTLILDHLAALRQEIQFLVTSIEVVIGPDTTPSSQLATPATVTLTETPR